MGLRPFSNRMSIQEISTNFKRLFSNSDAHLALIIVVVACGSFWLGRLSETQNVPKQAIATETQVSNVSLSDTFSDSNHEIATSSINNSATPQSSLTSSQGAYVASKSGTKYHLPWCGSAKQIKEENKIWFQTKEEAERAGYSPAANCKGI